MTQIAKPPAWWKSPLIAAILFLLIACAVGWYLTRDSAPVRSPAKQPAAPAIPVDERLFKTARQVSALADTPDEQDLARQAVLLADHELDQAFATALREATTPRPVTNPALQKIQANIAALKARIAARQKTIASLSRAAASSTSADDQLELARAQLALDENELEDAQQDLAREGGDEHARLERTMQGHEATQREPLPPAASPVPASSPTFAGQIRAFLALSDRQHQVQAALQQAAARAATSSREHKTLEGLVAQKPVAVAPDAAAADQQASDEEEEENAAEEDPAAMLDRLRRLTDQRKTLSELDRRIQDSEQLADLYRRWSADLELRSRAILHEILFSSGLLLVVILGVVVLSRVIGFILGRQADRRRRHQLRLILIISVQVVGLLTVLLIIFGPPSQMPTIIGLATAGLTVVMKDFIVSFIGWFTLMGRNGVRIGDWVEIEGVGGEVIEIGILHTVLLEMGNSTDTGHPSGRRVSFLNKFALERHWFNFSTGGQWLWDELQVTLPVSANAYQMAARIRDAVDRETQTDAATAEQDWERITRQYGSTEFSARPSMDVRPSGTSIIVIVRYITRGPQRYEVKSRLYKTIVGVLHGTPGGDATASELQAS